MGRQRSTPLPTQQRLRELFNYHPDGYFVRRMQTGTKTYAGQVVKGSMHRAYLRVTVDKLCIYLHQAVFLWHHGYVPEMIDHEDRDKLNNRIGNLRPSSPSHNGHNRGHTSKSQTMVKGVFVEGQKFLAQRTVDSKAHYLGLFATVAQAEQALLEFDRRRQKTCTSSSPT